MPREGVGAKIQELPFDALLVSLAVCSGHFVAENTVNTEQTPLSTS